MAAFGSKDIDSYGLFTVTMIGGLRFLFRGLNFGYIPQVDNTAIPPGNHQIGQFAPGSRPFRLEQVLALFPNDNPLRDILILGG